MTIPDQMFWFVDEVEAQWQDLRRKHPAFPFVECSWTNELRPCMDVVARILNVTSLGGSRKIKPHARGAVNFSEYLRLDFAYQAKMQYTRVQQALIRAAQF